MNCVDVEVHVLGWNEKGLIGFMHGGKYLTYVEGPDNIEEFALQHDIPRIENDMVREVNARIDELKSK